ncbi:MAG TPA: S9 family peptidase [Longimicrobium sp.]|nr:S9 family peptidase [Longimicrobium sp.]
MHRTGTLALLAALAAAAPAAAQDRRPLTPLDLYHLRTASDVTLSPDGRSVVYVVTQPDSATNKYRRDLWIARTDGSGAPRRLTWTNSPAVGSPAFSPDGTRLAFVSAREGGRPQVWILPLAEGGEAWPLTDLKTGAGGPVWSPRGDRVAFTSLLTPAELDSARDTTRAKVDAGAIRRIDRDRAAALRAIRAKLAQEEQDDDPRRVTRLAFMGETSIENERWRQLYVVDARPEAKPVRLTSSPWSSGAPSWSPDGASLVFTSEEPRAGMHPDEDQESDLVMIPAAGGAPRRIAEPGHEESDAAFSPDGRWIAYVRQHVDTPFFTAVNAELVVMRPDGTGRRSITAPLDRSVSDYAFTDDGWLYFTTPSEGSVPLWRVRPDGGEPQRVVTGPRGVLSFDVAGSTVAWSEMNPRRPGDVHAAALDGRGERRLTQLNDSLLARVHVADYEEIRYRSFDGRPVQGWFLRPLGVAPRQAPLAVEIHGGPHAMWGPGEASMWLEYQSLVGAGYTVFFANPRGSGGYGQEGLRSIHRSWGTPPARDILIGADSILARGLADPALQATTGGSYAGYMVAWLIAKESPERFRAAVAQRGVYDLSTWWGASNTWRLFEGEFGGRPWEQWEIAREQSPITHVAGVRTPLLMLHGENDYRTSIAGAEAFYRALKTLGRPVEFVRYPREGHELTRSGEPAHRVDHMLRIVEWFERHLRPETSPVRSAIAQ